MGKFSDRNRKDSGNEGHWKKDDRHNCEYHDRLPLSACKCGLVPSEAGFQCICMFLFEVEEVSQL